MSEPRHLVVVGSNPPTTSGERTLRRVELARELLGFQTAELTNLFPLPTYRTTGISEVGQLNESWEEARPSLQHSIEEASAVLLAYGVAHPTGPARQHRKAQVAWLDELLAGVPELEVYWVGGEPRHPSRWHRFTHRVNPSRTFRDVLREVLILRDPHQNGESAIDPVTLALSQTRSHESLKLSISLTARTPSPFDSVAGPAGVATAAIRNVAGLDPLHVGLVLAAETTGVAPPHSWL